jgi:hypothetical protein
MIFMATAAAARRSEEEGVGGGLLLVAFVGERALRGTQDPPDL